MSDSHDYLLDYEYDVLGEDLLNRSADCEEEPIEEEVVFVEEVQFQPQKPAEPAEAADPGCMLVCGERDIFDEDAPQLYTVYNGGPQISNPGGSWSSCPFSRGGGGP